MKLKYHLFIPIFALIASQIPIFHTSASTCSDVVFVFARGSGSALGATNYQTYRTAIVEKLAGSSLSYDFYELGTDAYGGVGYPAVAVGTENFGNFTNALGAYVGAGTSYAYGKSIDYGVRELVAYTREMHSACPSTKFVLAGYSQGAQVISTALPQLNQSTILYSATFGDPKLYLPEGKGAIPDACRGKNLSPYRVYVPDCRAYEGILGGTNPYQPSSYTDGKVGTWCIYHDIMCSAYINLTDPITTHLNYEKDGMYSSAANTIYSKLVSTYPSVFQSTVLPSGYDSILMFDATESMRPNIDTYKAHALRIVQNIIDNGGRISLYAYRDLRDGDYAMHQYCDFLTCNASNISDYIQSIPTFGGDDGPESLLHALKVAMQTSTWQQGAKKSVVVLTDNYALNPDRDGTTADDIIALSRSIDPVSVYVVAPDQFRVDYQKLTSDTGGTFFALEESTDLVISEDAVSSNLVIPSDSEPLTTVTNISIDSISSSSVRVKFSTNAARVYIAMNDMILGYATTTEFTLEGIDPLASNTLSFVPYSAIGKKGTTANVALRFTPDDPSDLPDPGSDSDPDPSKNPQSPLQILAPKTGQF